MFEFYVKVTPKKLLPKVEKALAEVDKTIEDYRQRGNAYDQRSASHRYCLVQLQKACKDSITEELFLSNDVLKLMETYLTTTTTTAV